MGLRPSLVSFFLARTKREEEERRREEEEEEEEEEDELGAKKSLESKELCMILYGNYLGMDW